MRGRLLQCVQTSREWAGTGWFRPWRHVLYLHRAQLAVQPERQECPRDRPGDIPRGGAVPESGPDPGPCQGMGRIGVRQHESQSDAVWGILRRSSADAGFLQDWGDVRRQAFDGRYPRKLEDDVLGVQWDVPRARDASPDQTLCRWSLCPVRLLP